MTLDKAVVSPRWADNRREVGWFPACRLVWYGMRRAQVQLIVKRKNVVCQWLLCGISIYTVVCGEINQISSMIPIYCIDIYLSYTRSL